MAMWPGDPAPHQEDQEGLGLLAPDDAADLLDALADLLRCVPNVVLPDGQHDHLNKIVKSLLYATRHLGRKVIQLPILKSPQNILCPVSLVRCVGFMRGSKQVIHLLLSQS